MSRRTTITMAAVAAALTVAAAVAWLVLAPSGTADEQPRTMTVNGNITLTTTHVDYWSGTLGEKCSGTGPFKDLAEGAPVTVYDTDGNILGHGQLRKGAWYDSCVFGFTVTQIPEVPTIQVEVSGRGKVAFDLGQVKAGDVRLSVGP